MQRLEHRFVAMGGPCRLRLDHDDTEVLEAAIDAAESRVRELEARYSRYLPNSLTAQINQNAGSGTPTAIDPETAGLLRYADTLFQESDGLFDLTSGVLREAWDFKSETLPRKEDVDRLLKRIGWSRVQWSETEATLDAGMELDFGGCVKEYAADSAAATIRSHGIKHALVDLAGDITTLGTQASGAPWQIGIRHPRENARAIAQVPLDGMALASSGDYERCIVVGGKRYGHILNPRTGWPCEGLVAVTVLAEQCLIAGSSATLAMLKPSTEALDWLHSLGLPWFAVDSELKCHGSIAATDQ